MTGFTLYLQSPGKSEAIENVTSFVGRDASGAFGVMSGHERMMSVLEFGMVRFECAGQGWQYAALPGGVLYFDGRDLFIVTRHYIIGADPDRLAQDVENVLLAEEETLQELKVSINQFEQEMVRRLWRMQHEARGFDYG